MSAKMPLTTNAGCPVVDNQNVMTAEPRGPVLCSITNLWREGRTSTASVCPSASSTPRARVPTASSR